MAEASSKSRGYDVVVIGAGHNGLTAAAFLAKAGRKVLVLERRPFSGGLAAAEAFHDGYKTLGVLHDTTGVRSGVVDALGLERHGLERTDGPPPVLVPHENGGLVFHHEPANAAEGIAALSSRDADRYSQYRAFIEKVRPVVMGLLDEPPTDIFSVSAGATLALVKKALALRRLGAGDMTELSRVAPMCIGDWLGEWFESNVLKAAIAAPALQGTFMGPRSPGSATLLLLHECAAGPAVKGGPAKLVEALEKAAAAHGAEIRTAAEAESIRVSEGKVSGVALAGGEEIGCDVVAASCDPKRTFLSLLSGRGISEKMSRRVRSFRTRGVTAKVNIALGAPLEMSGLGGGLEHIRTGESLDQLERAFDAVKYRGFSQHPVLDIYLPAASSPDFAPAGHTVLSILVHYASYDLDGGWDASAREKLADSVLHTLSRHASGVKERIAACEVLSPVDIEERYGATGGHIHHGEHAIDQLIVRPVPECMRYSTPIDGLYLCGSGTHPGGGLTCALGALAAKVILGR